MVAYEQIKELSEKHDIYLFSFYTQEYDALVKEMSKFCTKLYLFKDNKTAGLLSMLKTLYNFKSIQANYYYRYGTAKELEKIYNSVKPDLVHVQSFRMAGYFMNKKNSKSIDLIDAYSLNMRNRAVMAKSPLKFLWYLEYFLLKRYENKIMCSYDKKTIISLRDKKYLGRNDIIVNPLGTSIDINNIVKIREMAEKGRKQYINIIFQGNMSYYPNVEAVEYLIKNLFGKIKLKYENVKLYIVGGSPSKRILRYRNHDIIVTGYVKSMEEYLAKANIAMYPIFSATGMQDKVLEAMASKVPCIISQKCAEGIEGLKNMENVLIAQNEEDYLKYFKLLMEHKDIYNNITDNALKLVQDNYSWKKHVSILENLWSDLDS